MGSSDIRMEARNLPKLHLVGQSPLVGPLKSSTFAAKSSTQGACENDSKIIQERGSSRPQSETRFEATQSHTTIPALKMTHLLPIQRIQMKPQAYHLRLGQEV